MLYRWAIIPMVAPAQTARSFAICSFAKIGNNSCSP
jgi:hypothetical protein